MNNNGDLSFNSGFSDFSPQPFPISTPLIAPFWADLYTEYFGSLWYRLTTDSDIIERIREEVASAFPELTTFSATEVLIATWDHVGYCCSSNSPVKLYTNIIIIDIICVDSHAVSYCCFFSQTVTFQCILATDGINSFVFFLYGDGEINSYLSRRAQVGLNAGNGVDFISVNGSLTSSIFNIDQESNVGCPGVFVYQVNGGVQQPESGRNGKFEYIVTSMFINITICTYKISYFHRYCHQQLIKWL